jgi:hypothetical protein
MRIPGRFAVVGALALLIGLGGSSEAPDQDPTSESACPLAAVNASDAPGAGSARQSALCAVRVEVGGRLYDVGVGRFLLEDSLDLTPYGTASRWTQPMPEATVWALAGVDPGRILVMRANVDARDDLGPQGPYVVLWAEGAAFPPALCAYADPDDPQFPVQECPPPAGRSYVLEIVTACEGGQVPTARLGGRRWQLPDPLPGEFVGPVEYGTVRLISDDLISFTSDRGVTFELVPASAPADTQGECSLPIPD